MSCKMRWTAAVVDEEVLIVFTATAREKSKKEELVAVILIETCIRTIYTINSRPNNIHKIYDTAIDYCRDDFDI